LPAIPPAGETCETQTIVVAGGALVVAGGALEVCVAVGSGARLLPVLGVAVFPGGGPGLFDGLPPLAEGPADPEAEGPADPEAGLVGTCWPPAGLPVGGALQVSVYVAGAEAVVTGLVTTSTASPEPETAGGVTASARTGLVPAAANVRLAGPESLPSDQAQ
jgi:hypothetical protein